MTFEQLRAWYDAAKQTMQNHNDDCANCCQNMRRSKICGTHDRDRKCSACPKDWMIDIPEDVDGDVL